MFYHPKKPGLDVPRRLYHTIVLYLLQISAGLLTLLENPAIYIGDDINKASIHYRKGGVKAPSFLSVNGVVVQTEYLSDLIEEFWLLTFCRVRHIRLP